jgi:hypothetical protein
MSIGNNWAEIWASGVWANNQWAVSPILKPSTVFSNFGWTAIGGTLVSTLIDVSDVSYIRTLDMGNVVQFALTQSPYTSVTGATLKLRIKSE